MEKPNGFTALGQKAQEQLETLGLTDLPGIADRMESRLNKSRIKTVKDLYSTDELKLKKALPIFTRYYTAHADSTGLKLYIDVYRKDEDMMNLIYNKKY